MTDHDPVVRSYLPGEWYAVLGPSLVLALPPDRRERAAAAWSAVDAGTGADELLDLVLAAGLGGLAGLALVSTEGGRTRALARGQVVCLLVSGEQETVADGRSATTWVEASAEGVTEVSVELGRATDGSPHAVADGLVRASRVLWPAEVAGSRAAVVPISEGLDDPPAADPPPAAAAVALDPPAAEEPVAEEPVVAEPVAAEPVAAEPVVAEPVEEEPETVAQPLPGWQPVADDHDGRTQDGSWGEEMGLHQAGIPGQRPAPAVTSRPVAALELSTGERLDVDRVLVLGRAPEARRFSSTEQPRLVTVPSPQQEISSTHLEVRPGTGADHGSAVATDLGSTNGTVLAQPGLPAESLTPGIPVQLLPGAVIDLGDGLSITVVNP